MKSVARIRLLFAAVLAAAFVVGLGCEMSVFTRAFFPKKTKPLAKRIVQVRKKCAEKFPFRMAFVALNGGFVRVVGQNFCNGVVRMEQGDMLIDPNLKRYNMRSAAASMADFSSFCDSNGARFCFVQLPKRLAVGEPMLPPGECDRASENADELLAALARRGIDHVDGRRLFASTSEDVRKNFFRTDHHWKIDTAFRASGLMLNEIAARCPVPSNELAAARHLLSSDSWSRNVLPNVFLGSLGRRTGPLFAGKDDLVVLRPRFATEMSMAIPERDLTRCGSFEETVMWRLEEVLASTNDVFSIDAYTSLYVGGLYSLVRHENRRAPVALKVLLVGDSFARPVEGFLSVVFRQLDFVDLRRCDPGFSLAEFVRRVRPDIVVQIQNPSSLVAYSTVGVKSKLPIMFEYGVRKEDKR